MELIITLLELFRHERFTTIGVEYVRFNPHSKTQMIIGSNGSGKSTLLEELTPYPPKSSKFGKGGYKHIELKFNNKTYILRSEFNESQSHSFVVIDNEGEKELNVGHTFSVQKELVKQVFGITQQTHELSLGIKRFTDMGTEERKALLTELCEADFTYALKSFQALKDKQRDLVGSIKINQKRAVLEANKLMSKEDLDRLEKKHLELSNSITQITNMRTPISDDLDKIEEMIKNLSYQTERTLLDVVKNVKTVYKSDMFTQDELLESLLLEKQIEISKTLDITNRLSDEISQLQKGIIEINDVESIAELEATLQQIILTKIDINNQVLHCIRQFTNSEGVCSFDIDRISSIDKTMLQKLLLTIEEAEPNYMEIISKLPDNSITQYSKSKYIHLYKQQLEDKTTLEGLRVQHNNTLAEIKQLEKKKEEKLTCPNCDHVYHKDYDEIKHKRYLDLIPILYKEIEDLTKKTDEVDQLLKEMDEYFKIEDTLYEFFNYHKTGNPLWNFIKENNIVNTKPHELSNYFNFFKTMIQKEIEKRDWLDKEIHYNETITKARLLQEQDKQEQKQHYENLNKQLEEYTQKYNKLQAEIRDIKQYSVAKKQLLDLKQKLQQHASAQEDLIVKKTLQLSNIAIGYIVKELSEELLEIKQQICRYDIQKNIVDNINNTIEELKKEEAVISTLIKGLSPTTGLIAKGLVGFIQRFVKDTNDFIKLIWTKPLEILPPSIDEDSVTLDYRFPVMLKRQISDVSEGSKAMQEIFNLAFMITAMKYRRMGYYPLYLDEFASSMDPKHRDISFSVIENIVTKTTFSQVFLVSHVEKFYGSLRTADLSVMCPKNLYLPKDVEINKHLIIK